MNATGNAERLVARLNFDVLRKSSLHSVNLLIPKSILGHHLILDYTKFFSPFSFIYSSDPCATTSKKAA